MWFHYQQQSCMRILHSWMSFPYYFGRRGAPPTGKLMSTDSGFGDLEATSSPLSSLLNSVFSSLLLALYYLLYLFQFPRFNYPLFCLIYAKGTRGWVVSELFFKCDGHVFESNQWLSFDLPIQTYSRLKSEFLLCVEVFQLYSWECSPVTASGRPQVRILAVDVTMDVVGEGHYPSLYACVRNPWY